MTEDQCLAKMKAPSDPKPGKWGGGIIQILVTHACDKACFGCTQGSNLKAPRWQMTVEQFRAACHSLKNYFGVVGMFGGNPAMHKEFKELCAVMREEIPFNRRGLWCNNPITLENAKVMSGTFNPAVSNLNVHMDKKAFDLFKEGWPESRPFGLTGDSRHSPPWVAMKDLDCLPVFDRDHKVVDTASNTESHRHNLISDCDINQHWSPAIGVFRGELRAWFCEIAMSQSIHHQDDPDYPDTGVALWDREGDPHGMQRAWWLEGMGYFRNQVRKHCHECGVPLRGHGELALNEAGTEQVSQTHLAVYNPKRAGRAVELVMKHEQLGAPLRRMTNYIENART